MEDRRQADEATRHGAEKLNGSLVYAIDVKLPGMLCAAIKDCPVFGGKLVSFDETKIAGMPGRQARRAGERPTVAVVADTWWRAKKALEALPIVWDEGPQRDADAARTIAAHLKEGLNAASAYAHAQRRRHAEGDRRRGEEGRGRLQHAVPRARDDGADELHGPAHGGPRRGVGGDAERRGRARRAVRGSPACRSSSARSTSTHWAAASAGAAARRTTCGRPWQIAKELPGRSGQADLEPRRGHDARFLPADLAVPDGAGHRRRRATSSRCTCACRPVDQRVQQPGGRAGRQGRPAAAGLLREARRRADGIHGAEPARSSTRCATRTCRWARGAASTRTRTACTWSASSTRPRRPRSKDPLEFRRALMGKHPEAPRGAERRGGEGRLGHAAAARRPSRHRAVHGLRQLFGGGGRGVGQRRRQGQGAPHGARARTAATR